MASKKRIEYNSLPDNYVNGRILTKDDLNAIVGLLRAGVNANFDEIRKVITGTDTAVVKNLDSQRPTDNEVGDIVYVVNYEGETNINAHTGIKMYEWNGTEWVLKDTLSLKTLYDKVVNKLDTVSTTAQTVASKVTYTSADGIVVNQLQLPAENGQFVKIQYTIQANDNRYHVLEAVMPDGRILQLNEEIQATVKNAYGSPVLDGEVGVISGSSGNIMTAILANPSNPTHALRTIGVFTQNLATGAIGKITNFGFVSDVPLANLQQGTGTEYAVNQPLWVSTSGKLTNVKPAKPTSQIEMGIIVRITGSATDIFVYPRVMPRILDLSDVDDTTKADKRVLEYVDLGFGAGYTRYTDRLTDLETTVSGLEQAVLISEVVAERPVTGIEHHIYFVKETTPLGESLYKEWMWIDGAWELMGTSEEIIANEDADPFANVTVTRSDSISLTAGADMYLVATGTNNLYGNIVNVRPTTGASTYLTNETASSTMWQDENEWYVATTTKPYNSTTGNSNAISLDLTKAEMSYDGPNASKNRVTVLSNKVELVAPQIDVTGTLNITGNIVQDGTAYETHAEQIYTEKDHIILRDKAVSGLTTGTYAGLITKLADGTNDAFFGYNGNGIARVGDITYNAGVPDFSGTQALATRQDSPTANGVAYWNDTDKRFDTNSTVITNPAATGNVPLTINALSGQTANLQNWSKNNVIQAFIEQDGALRTYSIRNPVTGNNATINISNNGIQVERNIADINPALTVNLANSGANGYIARFQKSGVNVVAIDSNGDILTSGTLRNRTSLNNSYYQASDTGSFIVRNINDANPALIVNEQQGTGDILRLQYGGVTQAYFLTNGVLKSNGIYNLASANNSKIDLNNTGVVIFRDIADTNPALKVNLANAGATGNIAEFQFAGTNKFSFGTNGYLYGAGLSNSSSTNYSLVLTQVAGTLIQRNINDANPALTVNEQQGTGDILRLQFGGATKSVFNKDGWLGIGTTAPSASLDVSYGGVGIIIGADSNAYTRTNANQKYSRIGAYHYTNSEEPIGLLYAISDVSSTDVLFGGGSGLLNAATKLRFFTASNNTTTTGTERMTILSDGNVGIGTTTPSAKLHVAGDLKVDGDIISTKSAVDYTTTYSNTISSTYGGIVPYKDGTPLVTEINGRTMPVVTQLVSNPDFTTDFSGWTSGASILSVTNGILSITGNGTDAVPYAQQIITNGATISNKYFAYFRARVTNSNALRFRVRFNMTSSIDIVQETPVINQWYNLSNILTATATGNITLLPTHVYADAATANGKVMEVDFIYLFNVTTLIANKTYSPMYNKTFDLMSDAEIKLQMDEWVQTNKIPTSVVQHLENTTLKSTGKNLFTQDNLISYAGIIRTDYDKDAFKLSMVTYTAQKAYQIKFFPLTQYTITGSMNYVGTNQGFRFGVYYTDGTNEDVYTPTPTKTAFTFKSNASKTIDYIGYKASNNGGVIEVYNFQLEQGSTATAYTPYKSETQSFVHGRLSRLPNNVSDKIRYDNGKYVLDRYVQEYKISPTPTTPTISSKDMYRVQVTLPATPIDWTASSTHPILFSSVQGTLRKYGDWSSVPTSSYGWAVYTDGVNRFIDVVIPIGSTFATVMGEITIYYQLATPLLATQTVDVDGILVQDSVTTIEQTQTLATEYDVKFAINAEQTVVNLVEKDKIQQEVIDANEQKLEPITNTSGNLALTGTTTLTSTVTTNLTVNTGGALLAVDNANGDYGVSALSNYKYIEVRASIDTYRYTSVKLPSTYFVYNSGVPVASGGITLMVTGKPGGLAYDSAIFTVRANNAGLTSITIDADMSNYDIDWEVYGWNY